MKQILLILIGFSSLSLAEFSREGDIVTDSISLLQWQDNAIGERMTWESAIDYCENTLELGGYGDWRLPNINELKSIVDRSRYNPSIVSAFTKTSSSNYYWSSTTYRSYSNYAWIVYFNNGNVYNNAKSNNNFVRCVRAGE